MKLFWFSSSVVPHITDAIQEWVVKQAKVSVDDDDAEPQVCVIEVSCCLTACVCVCVCGRSCH